MGLSEDSQGLSWTLRSFKALRGFLKALGGFQRALRSPKGFSEAIKSPQRTLKVSHSVSGSLRGSQRTVRDFMGLFKLSSSNRSRAI